MRPLYYVRLPATSLSEASVLIESLTLLEAEALSAVISLFKASK